MKKYIISAGLLLSLFAGCSLDKDPISDYNEKNIGREAIKAQYESMYTFIQGTAQEFWMLDLLQNTETRADNAYAGATNASITTIEKHSQDASNSNITRDWVRYLEGINTADIVITNANKNLSNLGLPQTAIDDLRRWKSEALIMRAWLMFDMVRFWGDVPILVKDIPEIPSIEEAKDILFPARSSQIEVYEEIKRNLEESLLYAPDVQSGNKFFFSKAVANALLAKVYAEKPIRDYAKTIQYCDAVIAEGFSLVENYADLFQLNDAQTDMKKRNTSESIFEITYAGGGSWLSILFGKNHANPSSKYDWAKWVTPSRDLIAAFDAENDQIRKNQAIIWGQPSWSTYYPSDNYPFMYKIRSEFNSVIKLRLADILLLKAEALVATGNLAGAATLVNQIRTRVNLPALASNITSSQEAMKKAVLNERRLELAFEGHRWFDLVRNDVVIETINTLNSRDSGRLAIEPINENKILFPVPQSEIGKNPKLTQNLGY